MKRNFILGLITLPVLVLCYVSLQFVDVREYLTSTVHALSRVIKPDFVTRDSTEARLYDKRFVEVSTASEEGEPDTIAFLATRTAPLIVSLHSWSGDWREYDPIAEHIADLDFHYVHPDFQGANNHPDACLSETVVQDIDKAIQWAVDNASVDEKNIIITGVSGGGYTALGYRQLTTRSIKQTMAWVPITDLDSWYHESISRNNKYAKDMLACIGGDYDQALLRSRSPLYHDESNNGSVSLFAGIHDGHTGAVPISHSISYFNNLATSDAQIGPDTSIRLLNREATEVVGSLGERDIYLDRQSNGVRIVIFEGGHEMLPDVAIDELREAERVW